MIDLLFGLAWWVGVPVIVLGLICSVIVGLATRSGRSRG